MLDKILRSMSLHVFESLIKQSISRNYEFSFSPISEHSISKYISSLKSNKVVGHDGLHAAFLRCSGDNMSTPLWNVFNVSLLVIFLVLPLGLILIPYTRRKMICAKKIIVVSMFWPLFLRYLKEFYPVGWWISLYLKEIVLEPWQWICQRPLIACHSDY